MGVEVKPKTPPLEAPTSQSADEYGRLLLEHFRNRDADDEVLEPLLVRLDRAFASLSENDRRFFNRVAADFWQLEGEEFLRPAMASSIWQILDRLDRLGNAGGLPKVDDVLRLLDSLRYDLPIEDSTRALIRGLCYRALHQDAVATAFFDFAWRASPSPAIAWSFARANEVLRKYILPSSTQIPILKDLGPLGVLGSFVVGGQPSQIVSAMVGVTVNRMHHAGHAGTTPAQTMIKLRDFPRTILSHS